MQSITEVRAFPRRALEAVRGEDRSADTRRNIVTSSVQLSHLVDREFWVGAVLTRDTRLCEPCKHLDDLTQHVVMSGLIHRGGLRGLILRRGIRISDAVRPKTS